MRGRGRLTRLRILCVNCNICMNKLRRYPALELDTAVTALLCSWIYPRIITEDDFVCAACKDLATYRVSHALLQGASGSDDHQARSSHQGHTNVCLVCGCSILRRQSDRILRDNPSELQQSMINILESRLAPRQITVSDCVCHPCWLRTKREARRSNQTEAPGKEIIRDLHSRGVQHQIDGTVTAVGGSVATSTGVQTSHDSFGGLQLPNDMDNYMEYHVMGSVAQVRMKPRCIPTKFECQADERKRTSNTTEPPYILKKKRSIFIEECINDVGKRSITTKHLELGETSSGSSASHRNKENITQEEHKTADKLIQVHMTPKFRSKAFQTEIKLVNQMSSPLKPNLQLEGSPRSENEIKVFCPKCDTEVSHTAEGILEDQTKILIAKVYHYLEQEYEELKTIYGDLDLTPLSKFRQRTALATGVTEMTVLQILKEEEGRNAGKRQEPSEKRRRARKRSIQTDSSRDEDSSDDNVDVKKQSSDVHEVQTVKVEPPEYYNEEPEIYVPAAVKVEPSDVELNKEQTQPDPISLDVKTEPRTDVEDNEEPEIYVPATVKVEPSDVVPNNADETLVLNEPAGTKHRARQISRSDVIFTRSSLFGDTEMKAEEIEHYEEGIS